MPPWEDFTRRFGFGQAAPAVPLPAAGDPTTPPRPQQVPSGSKGRVVCWEDGSCRQVFPGDPDYQHAQYGPGGSAGGGGKGRV